MSIREFMRLIQRRWRIIVLMGVITTAIATVWSLSAQPMYAASVKLLVSAAQGSSALSSALAPNLLTQERISSYAQLASGPTVADEVVHTLGLHESPSVLAGRITATVPAQTVLLVISVTDPHPAQAQSIANEVGVKTARLVVHLESGRHAPSPVRATVAEPASLPTSPVSPKPVRNIAFGLVVGIALGLAVALLREVLDNRVKGFDDLAELGLPVLGVTHYERRMRSKPILGPEALDPSVAESLRQLRTNLEFVDIGGGRPRSLLIASPLAGEGKSTTTWNLGIAFAAARKRVVVVEADLRRPALSTRYLGVKSRHGLSEVLIGKLETDDVEVSWMDGRLTLLPSGTAPPNPSELLGSDSMRILLHRLSERADVVLIDAPPILPFADAPVVAAMVDATVLVVRANKTKREQALHAERLLHRVGARVCGAVITMAPRRGPESLDYGYYDAYGYDRQATESGAREGGRTPFTSGRAESDPRSDAELPGETRGARPESPTVSRA